jgi:hypothetical protein
MKHIVSWPVFTTYNRSLSRRESERLHWGGQVTTTFTHACESEHGNFSRLYHIRNYFTATLPRKKILRQNRGFEKPSTFGIGYLTTFSVKQPKKRLFIGSENLDRRTATCRRQGSQYDNTVYNIFVLLFLSGSVGVITVHISRYKYRIWMMRW